MRLFALSTLGSFGKCYVASDYTSTSQLHHAKLFHDILAAQDFRKRYWNDPDIDCKLVELEITIIKEMY